MKTLLTSLLITLTISTFGQHADNTLISFDGLYETECEFEVEDEKDGTQYYLRFYPDGKVISIGTECNDTIDKLLDWFHVNSEQVSIGNYKIARRNIRFSTTSKSGTVQYKGQIMDDKLIDVKWKSLINGKRGHNAYKFVYLNGLK